MVSAAATLLIHALVALSLELSGSAYFSGDPSGLQYVWAWMGMWLAGLAGVCLWGFRARVIQVRSMGCLIAVVAALGAMPFVSGRYGGTVESGGKVLTVIAAVTQFGVLIGHLRDWLGVVRR